MTDRSNTPESGVKQAVIYAAKSTQDAHGSIPTQLADCRAAAEREGRTIVGEFSDEAASAYHGNRGEGLERAKDAAIKFGAELWVQHSDRLARGDGITADHLAEIWFALRRHGVRLRSVQDDGNLEDVIRVVLIGERNFEDSARKSAATQAGKRRAANRGLPQFGVRPDGYLVVRKMDHKGDVIDRWMEFDPRRQAIYELIWDLAKQGYSVNAIVAELDRIGAQTSPVKANHRARPFDANRVRQTLDNPTYAGLIVHKGEIIGKGQWPSYISPEDFERLRAERAARGNVSRRKAGRPPERYVLARTAVCGECGSPMDCVTARHVNKDGTRSRRYVCRVHRERPRDCSAKPIDAGVVDRAFISNLDGFLGDVEGWHDKLIANQAGEHERMAAEVARAEDDLATADRVLAAAQARYSKALANDDQGRADGIEDFVTGQRAERERIERRLEAAQQALEATSDEPSIDPLLDFYGALRRALSERTSTARDDLKRLNLVVCDYFASVELTTQTEGVRVQPHLSRAAVERIVADWPRTLTTHPAAFDPERITAEDSPPLREIQATHNPQSRS